MMLVGNWRFRGCEIGFFQAVSRGLIGLSRGCGVVGILAIYGCSGQVEPQVQYVRVEVPVQVPCRAPDVTVPAWATAGLRNTDSLEVKVRALLAERRQRIGYEKELEAATTACR